MNDHALRDRVRAADPAGALPPLPADARTALLERAVETAPTRRTRAPRLPAVLLTGLAATAAAGAIVLMLPQPPSGAVVTLQVQGVDPAVSCASLPDFAVPALQQADTAFLGTVAAVDGATVEVVPDEVFRGDAIGLARLRIASGGGPALDGPVLAEGDRVLIAATDGQVAGCGLSATDSPELRQYYDAAFG